MKLLIGLVEGLISFYQGLKISQAGERNWSEVVEKFFL